MSQTKSPNKNRKIPASNKIELYFQCKKCIEEKPGDQSPAEWARFNVGWTKLGLQVWCVRHDCNVISIDFQGNQLPANLMTEETEALLKAGKSFEEIIGRRAKGLLDSPENEKN